MRRPCNRNPGKRNWLNLKSSNLFVFLFFRFPGFHLIWSLNWENEQNKRSLSSKNALHLSKYSIFTYTFNLHAHACDAHGKFFSWIQSLKNKILAKRELGNLFASEGVSVSTSDNRAESPKCMKDCKMAAKIKWIVNESRGFRSWKTKPTLCNPRALIIWFFWIQHNM